MLHLLRCLHFFTAMLDIWIRLEHVEGVKNVIADAISRNNLQVLFQQNPGCSPHPNVISASTRKLLISQRPDWQSNNWRTLFRSSLATVWQQAPMHRTYASAQAQYIKFCSAVNKPPSPELRRPWKTMCTTVCSLHGILLPCNHQGIIYVLVCNLPFPQNTGP